MKINYRLLLITFGIIAVITITSTIIFFSLTTSILESKLTNSFTKNSYEFAFKLRLELEKLDSEFHQLYSSNIMLKDINIDTTSLDILLPVNKNRFINKEQMKVSSKSYLNFSSFEIRKFIANNPNVLLNYVKSDFGIIYYGRIINDDFLNALSELTRVDIALVVKDVPNVSSNSFFVNQYLTNILEATKFLSNKNNYTVFTDELESVDFYATVYTSDNIYFSDSKVKFLLFTTSSEISEVRETMGMIMLILITAGAALSLVFVMLFTTKLRKQISLLSKAAAYASKGEFNQKVTIVSGDEIGMLTVVFNQMLSELRNKEKREKEYSEFLTLLNQNPTLDEIAEESLKTILKELGLNQGMFYIVNEKDIRLIKTFGDIIDGYSPAIDEKELDEIIEKKESKEILIKNKKDEIEDLPNIGYVIIVPIVYQNNVISIIELAGENSPQISAKEYIDIIHDQMAVGISNALIFAQLQKLVGELKKLNEQYQNQNIKITEKNEQLVRLHSELRQKADELEIEKSKALELTSLKSQFLASISHELRTPLNSIIGLSELVIGKAVLDKESHKRMNVVLRSGKKLLALINNILEFLKIETGKVVVVKESFLFSVLLKEIENLFEPLVQDKSLNFRIEYDIENDLLLVTDRQKLEQIITNLVGNAIKFTNDGEVVIKVSLLGDHELRIKVMDTGIGIKEKDLEVIFQEFRQSEGGTKRRYEGTGLGLAISREYVRLLGGEIYCDSVVNKGSEFTVLLRDLAIEKVDSYEPVVFNVGEGEEIVDDEIPKFDKTVIVFSTDENEKLVSDYMRLNNFNVVKTDNVEGLKRKCASECLAIIIIHDTKNKNSWSILRNIRSQSSLDRIPVISLNINRELKIGYGLKCFDYYLQPLNKDIYKKTIDKFPENRLRKPERVVIITDNNRLNIEIYDSIKTDLLINRKIEEITQYLFDVMPNMIFIEYAADTSLGVEIVDKIKSDKAIKNIPLYLGVPEDIKEIDTKIDELTKANKQQPLDVLKIIRDRLSEHFDDSQIVSIDKDDLREHLYLNEELSKDEAVQILVVDDDPDTLFTMGEVLDELLYIHDTATNGIECLAKLKEMRPGIILLDIMMPQMDGFETIKNIKNDKELKDIPVIALTAYAMLENKEIIEKHGFIDLITKPVNVNMIKQKLEKYLSKKNA